jgi:hypothetical protein
MVKLLNSPSHYGMENHPVLYHYMHIMLPLPNQLTKKKQRIIIEQTCVPTIKWFQFSVIQKTSSY